MFLIFMESERAGVIHGLDFFDVLFWDGFFRAMFVN